MFTRLNHFIVVLIMTAISVGCSNIKPSPEEQRELEQSATMESRVAAGALQEAVVALPRCFAAPTCKINPDTNTCFAIDESLEEVSGIAASGFQEGVFWVHNDEGSPSVYAVNIQGEIAVRVDLTDAENLDYEDISIFTADGNHEIYLGDIGKKGKLPGEVYVYRFSEPVISSIRQGIETLSDYQKITLTYPDQFDVLDFESLMVDPRDNDLYLFEKGDRRVFRAAGKALNADAVHIELELVSDSDTGDWAKKPSAASFSSTGLEFVVRDEEHAWIYSISPEESVADALKKTPKVIEMADEYNGEAITYGIKGVDFFTASENRKKGDSEPVDPQPISIYKRLNDERCR